MKVLTLLLGFMLTTGCAVQVEVDRENKTNTRPYSEDSVGVDLTSQALVLPPGSHPKASCKDPNHPHSTYPQYNPSPEQMERDQIYQLVAYAVVRADWQTGSWGSKGARGYNIGSILVNADIDPNENQIVCWARNTVIETGNETQHGEVRLMTNYLHNAKASSLRGKYRLYTTLEPCAMCGGMMAQQNLGVTLYGQTDPDFGNGLQRLGLVSHSVGGFCSYPRQVYSNKAQLAIVDKIDRAYADWRAADPGNRGMTHWLTTAGARDLYDEAIIALMRWQVRYPEVNGTVLSNAQNFIQNIVPTDYQALPYQVGCEGITQTKEGSND